MQKLLFFTNAQKILYFLIQNPDKEYIEQEISKSTGVSKSGTNFALRDLAKEGLVLQEKRGRMYFYKVPFDGILTKYLKILQNIILSYSLVEKLKKHSLKIVLYGSAARGENHSGSDIDIFIMSRNPNEVGKIMFKDKLREKIQYVAHSPNDLIKTKKSNPIFYGEIEKGIVLWERK